MKHQELGRTEQHTQPSRSSIDAAQTATTASPTSIKGRQANGTSAYPHNEWVRQLVRRVSIKKDPQESTTHLTARLARTSRPLKATDMNAKPSTSQADDVTPTANLELKADTHLDASEPFSQAINDLEGLLDEALLIAKQAAERKDITDPLTSLGDSDAVKRHFSEHGDTHIPGHRRVSSLELIALSRPSNEQVSVSESDESLADVEDNGEVQTHPEPQKPEHAMSEMQTRLDVSEPHHRLLTGSDEPPLELNIPLADRTDGEPRCIDWAPSPLHHREVSHQLGADQSKFKSRRKSGPFPSGIDGHISSVRFYDFSSLNLSANQEQVGGSPAQPVSDHGKSVNLAGARPQRPGLRVLLSNHSESSQLRSRRPGTVTEEEEGLTSDVNGQREEKRERNRTSLKNRRHVSLRDTRAFRKLRRQHPIARDWSSSRKRFVALIVCINTAFLGFIVGIYVCWQPITGFFLKADII